MNETAKRSTRTGWPVVLRRRRKGFTLIEMLVVIAVLALLIGISVPSLVRATIMARHAACAQGLHNVGLAFRMYLNTSDQIMPVAAAMPSLNLNDEPRIADVLAPFLNNEKALQCPSDNDRDFFASEGSSYQYNTVLGGQAVGKDFLSKRIGTNRMPVMHDYEPFHGPAGQKGSTNYLFADLHVGDLE